MVDRPATAQPKNAQGHHKKRHLGRKLIILLVLLSLLVWLFPCVASTGLARKVIQWAVNSAIYGRVEIDDISLGWQGPCRISNLKVLDTSDREVVQVDSIVCSRGLWRLLTSPGDFGNVKISRPRINLYVAEDGKVSIIHALSRRSPSKEPLKKLTVKIDIEDGSIRVRRYDGRDYQVRNIDGTLEIETPEEASGKVSWASADFYNLEIGPAIIAFRFHDKRLEVPLTTIPASGGKFRFRGIVDMHRATPVLQIAGPVRLIENVPIDVDFGNDFISRFIAIFYKAERLSGRVSLTVRDISLPIGKEIVHTGTGNGRLVLKDVKIQSSGLLSELVQLGGIVPTGLTSMRISDLDFRIDRGKIYYDDLSVILVSMLEMKFSGWAGFDDRIDMTVSLPVVPRQLERLLARASPAKVFDKAGLKKLGEILGEVPLLGKHLVDIHIVGTRSNPRFAPPEILKPLFKPALPIPTIPFLR